MQNPIEDDFNPIEDEFDLDEYEISPIGGGTAKKINPRPRISRPVKIFAGVSLTVAALAIAFTFVISGSPANWVFMPQSSSGTRDLLARANGGEARAQHNIGYNYTRGIGGFEQDYTQAAYWYRRAAEQGFVYSQFNLALMYYWGYGLPQSYANALYWYEKAAEQGDLQAVRSVVRLYSGEFDIADEEMAAYWIRRGAELGDVDFQMEVAGFYYYHDDDDVAIEQVMYWYRRAAEQGNVTAMMRLAAFYQLGFDDYASAFYWARRGAETGDRAGILGLAMLYVEIDDENGGSLVQARYWLEQLPDVDEETVDSLFNALITVFREE